MATGPDLQWQDSGRRCALIQVEAIADVLGVFVEGPVFLEIGTGT